MIRQTLTALLGLMIFAEPCLATAETKPKKSPPTPVPQAPQTSAPSKSFRQPRARQSYHPHPAQGGAKHSARGTPGT